MDPIIVCDHEGNVSIINNSHIVRLQFNPTKENLLWIVLTCGEPIQVRDPAQIRKVLAAFGAA